MVQLVLIGSLLCNDLMAWATLHKLPPPPLQQSLSLPPPQSRSKWVHPVIFESQPKIQLTQSLYKVTSFLDFQPFLKGFHLVCQYLEDFKKDLTNPKYIQTLIYESTLKEITPLANETLILKNSLT